MELAIPAAKPAPEDEAVDPGTPLCHSATVLCCISIHSLSSRGCIWVADDEVAHGGEKLIPKAAEEPVAMTHQQQMVLFVKAFTLTFVAEWGDRSQIATIALAADKNPFGVVSTACMSGPSSTLRQFPDTLSSRLPVVSLGTRCALAWLLLAEKRSPRRSQKRVCLWWAACFFSSSLCIWYTLK